MKAFNFWVEIVAPLTGLNALDDLAVGADRGAGCEADAA